MIYSNENIYTFINIICDDGEYEESDYNLIYDGYKYINDPLTKYSRNSRVLLTVMKWTHKIYKYLKQNKKYKDYYYYLKVKFIPYLVHCFITGCCHNNLQSIWIYNKSIMYNNGSYNIQKLNNNQVLTEEDILKQIEDLESKRLLFYIRYANIQKNIDIHCLKTNNYNSDYDEQNYDDLLESLN